MIVCVAPSFFAIIFADIGGLGAPIDGVLQNYRTFVTTGLLAVPAHLSYEEAACFPNAGVTAWNALYGGIPLKPGQTVVFQGTGGVSMFGLLFASKAGAKVRSSFTPVEGGHDVVSDVIEHRQ